MIGKKWARNDEKRQNSRYVRDFRTLTPPRRWNFFGWNNYKLSYKGEILYDNTPNYSSSSFEKKKRKLIFPLNSSKLFEQQLKLHFDTDIIITTIQVTIK